MGLFTGLLTLPLAPVRGTAWIAAQIADEAQRQLYDESRLRRELMQLELDHEDGLVGDEDYAARFDEILAAIATAHALAAEGPPPINGTEVGYG